MRALGREAYFNDNRLMAAGHSTGARWYAQIVRSDAGRIIQSVVFQSATL